MGLWRIAPYYHSDWKLLPETSLSEVGDINVLPDGVEPERDRRCSDVFESRGRLSNNNIVIIRFIQTIQPDWDASTLLDYPLELSGVVDGSEYLFSIPDYFLITHEAGDVHRTVPRYTGYLEPLERLPEGGPLARDGCPVKP